MLLSVCSQLITLHLRTWPRPRSFTFTSLCKTIQGTQYSLRSAGVRCAGSNSCPNPPKGSPSASQWLLLLTVRSSGSYEGILCTDCQQYCPKFFPSTCRSSTKVPDTVFN